MPRVHQTNNPSNALKSSRRSAHLSHKNIPSCRVSKGLFVSIAIHGYL